MTLSYLLSTSANALKMALNYPQELISFQNLHRMTDRATPEMFSNYKLALLLFKTFNDKFPLQEWTQLNFSIIITTRQSKFAINRNNRLCVGNNAICNRLNVLNDKIPLTWLNKNYSLYKIECKKLFLSFNWTISTKLIIIYQHITHVIEIDKLISLM